MAEDNVNLTGIGVQQVLHGLGGAVGGVLAGQSGKDLHAGLGAGGLIALAAHIGGVVALLAVDNNGLSTVAGLLGGPQAAFLGGINVGCTHEAGLTVNTYIGVHSQHRDVLINGGLERGDSSAGVVGSADDGVAASADLLLNHGDLTLDVALSAGAHYGDLHAQVSGGGVTAGLHIAPILGGQGLEDDGNLDVAAGGGRVALAGLVAAAGGSVAAAAGGQRQDHSQGQDQCEYFLHTSFLLLILILKRFQEPVFRR